MLNEVACASSQEDSQQTDCPNIYWVVWEEETAKETEWLEMWEGSQ